MLKLEDIIEIRKAKKYSSGYEIVFPNKKIIWLTKRRTIAGLLLLIKYEHCTEEDLVGTNGRLAEIKRILNGKFDKSWIKDRYGDANKPFSELWTEEGFSCIRAEGLKGNRQYVLNKSDHELLFKASAKTSRTQLNNQKKQKILIKQDWKCNICGSRLKNSKNILKHTFAKDRVKMEFDHRVPIEHGGNNTIENYQALCHYCNKSKRQICFICESECSIKCALVSPETSDIVLATSENISDRKNR
ncbi:HNH endonuclease [Streptococcus suis]|nr:HNH endonuclease [Streptococcus suis]NQK18187.1 HNH endonuclease [Streptococcus suis]